MFERFTGEARQVVVLAQEEARNRNHNYTGTEHLLLGFLALPGDVPAVRALRSLGFTREQLVADVERIIGQGTKALKGHIPFTPRAKKVLELSLREAIRLGVNHIGPEHLLLGILREGDGVGAQVLLSGDRTVDEIREAVLAVADRPTSTAGPARTPAAEQALALGEQLAAGAPVGTHHLLEAFTKLEDSMAGKALAGLGVTTDAVVAKVDELDLAQSSDITPEQAAAAALRWEADEQGVRIVTTDPETVAMLRRLVEQAGGSLTGDGPLAGAFIGLHQAIRAAAGGIDAALNPAEAAEATPSTLRERLRRRMRP
ncbi:Clp protease N-terminal domain-containing protein [Pseudonocardia sp. GCM10023141]|uniref:Clp protease N-terminal domain-containing protein n=1 Tax=Pseudonocardia sp. GCM10023141 TaxID=3252653 RepID=UPI003610AA48